MSWLRLDSDIQGWPRDQVTLRRRLVFDAADPRVNLSSAGGAGAGVVVEFVEPATLDHESPHRRSGRLRVRPLQAQPSAAEAELLGGHHADHRRGHIPPIEVTSANQKNAIWEVFSDKYIAVDSFTYTVDVTVSGPNFTDDP